MDIAEVGTRDIRPVDKAGPRRTSSLSRVSYRDIVAVLGEPNIEDDPDKVRWSWGFTVNGTYAAIWDYKGSGDAGVWSVYDPHGVIPMLFNSEPR